jgi:hypothetical protein
MKILLPFLAVIILLSYNKKENTTGFKTQTTKGTKIAPHFIEGDFDGDGNREKLVEFISDSLGNSTSLENIPEFEEWEDYVNFVFKKGISTHIYMEGKKADTLDLGISAGVYCLINIGDINKDKKDEIALVKDLPDFSRLNTCRIYTLCHSKWTELINFNVHEDAFDYYRTAEEPVFNEIKEFLEFHNGKWMYKDYLIDDYETAEEVGKMKVLRIPKCK